MKMHTKRKLMAILSVALLVTAGCGNGNNEAVEDPQAYYEDRAQHLTDYQLDDGSFVVRENKEVQKLFDTNALKIDIKGEVSTADEKAVQAVVTEYNKITLSSLFSGVYQLMPKEQFVSDGIYQEANARNLYELFNKPGAGENVKGYDFALDYTQIEVGETYAKVVVKRQADVVYDQSNQPERSYGSVEGYLLKKENDAWKIDNIIFATDAVSETFDEFVSAEDEAEWIKMFTFDNCQRKDYESDMNFRDYIDGSVDMPKVKIDLMQLDYDDSNEASDNK